MFSPEDIVTHRDSVRGHCYRMLGSATEAEDAAQETLARAVQSLERFEGRSSLRTWLLTIATRVCLDTRESARRERPMGLGPAGGLADPLDPRPAEQWVEPVPDGWFVGPQLDPASRVAVRQSIRLAFVAALQRLPARQRAALLLADVMELSSAEIAATLDMTVAAVNSALQRARATLKEQVPPRAEALEPDERVLLERYVAAFERYDMAALSTLIAEDATMCMPPLALWLEGREHMLAWFVGRGGACRGSRLVPTLASGCPAYAQYKAPSAPGEPYRAWGLGVLELDGPRVIGLSTFLDVERVFPLFGLALTLDG